jgi:signal transduction histidine kinase
VTWRGWRPDGTPLPFSEWPLSRVLRGETFQNQVLHAERVETGYGFDASYNGCPIRDADGKVRYGFITIRDITEQVHAERQRDRAHAELRDANERLREADRRKDEFLAMLAHELRNPLAPLRNSSYILRHAAPTSEQASRSRDVIERQTSHLTRLVDDLLDVTRIARAKIELRRERVDLRTVVARSADDIRFKMDREGIALRVALPDAAVWVDADPTRVAQVVGNLLENASKFTPRGGEVVVSVTAEVRDAAVRVRDTGVGIEAALLARVFEPFVQADRSLARTQGGLGLGLALVKGLAELHGGTVEAHSGGSGHGAEFVVRLPRAAPAPAPRDRAAHGAPSNGGRRVLVVDDNRDAAESLADIVRMLGHTAEVAFDGRAAVEQAGASAFDVVLCDIGLPGLDGFEVARRLRADPFLHRPCLVALSGYAGPDDLERSRRAGFVRHLAKPPDIAALERTLSEVCPSRH